MMTVHPLDPSGGGIPLGPDPLMVFLRLLRGEPGGTVQALLAPLRSSSPLLWSVTVPGIKIPLIISLPPESLPAGTPLQIFPGTLFEESKKLFFRSGQESDDSPPFLLLLGEASDGLGPDAEKMSSREIIPWSPLSELGDKLFDSAGQKSNQIISEPHFLRSGEVPAPLFQKIHGPVPPGLSFPGGSPPSVTFEICWPDRGESPSKKESGTVSDASFSFRLVISYANSESLDLAGVFDPASRKISFYPRSSSRSLLSYWSEVGKDLGAALEANFSILMESHRNDHG